MYIYNYDNPEYPFFSRSFLVEGVRQRVELDSTALPHLNIHIQTHELFMNKSPGRVKINPVCVAFGKLNILGNLFGSLLQRKSSKDANVLIYDHMSQRFIPAVIERFIAVKVYVLPDNENLINLSNKSLSNCTKTEQKEIFEAVETLQAQRISSVLFFAELKFYKARKHSAKVSPLRANVNNPITLGPCDLGSSGVYYRNEFVRKAPGLKFTPVKNLVGGFIQYPFPKSEVLHDNLFKIIQLPKRMYL